MYKRICCLLILVTLITNSFAFAEQSEEGSFFGAFGGFLSDTISNAGEAIDSAVNDVSGFISDAKDDIENSLSNTGNRIMEFWDNTSGNVRDAWNWAGTFIKDQGEINEATLNTMNQLASWMEITGDSALNTLKGVFEAVTSSLGIAGDKATEIWKTIYNYSVEKNINMVVLVKLTLAILIRISLGGDILIGEMAGDYIDQIVMDWFTDFNINSEEDAEKALNQLRNSLDEVIPEK